MASSESFSSWPREGVRFPHPREFKRKGGAVKIEIDGNKIKISGNRGVSLIIYAFDQKNNETFSLSLSYRGFERGILPMIDIYDENTIKVTNNMKTGTYLLDGADR